MEKDMEQEKKSSNSLGGSHTGGEGSRQGLQAYDMNWSMNDYQKRYWGKKDERDAWGPKYVEEISLPDPSSTVQFHPDSYPAPEEKTRLRALAVQQGNTAAAFLLAVSTGSSKEKEITTSGSGCNLFSVSEDPQQGNDQDPPQEVSDSPAPKNTLSEEADGVEKKPANEDKIDTNDSGNQGKTLLPQYPGSFELIDRQAETKRTKYQEECAAKWTGHQENAHRLNDFRHENAHRLNFTDDGFKEQVSRAPSRDPSMSLSASASAGLNTNNSGSGAEKRWGFGQENSSSLASNGHDDNNNRGYWQSWGAEKNGDEKSGDGKWAVSGKIDTNDEGGCRWSRTDGEYHKTDDLAWMERMKMDEDKRDGERAVWDDARSSGWSDLGWSRGKNTSSAGWAHEWGQGKSYGTSASSSNYYYDDRKKWYKRGDGQWDYYYINNNSNDYSDVGQKQAIGDVTHNGYDNGNQYSNGGGYDKWDRSWGARWDVNWNASSRPLEAEEEKKVGEWKSTEAAAHHWRNSTIEAAAPLGEQHHWGDVVPHDLTDSRASVSIENPSQELVELTADYGGPERDVKKDDGRGFLGPQHHLVISNSESDGSDHRPKVIPETPSPCHEQEEGDEKGPLVQLLSSNFDLTPAEAPVARTSFNSGDSPISPIASAPDPLKSATWDESTLFHAGSTLAIHDASWECSLAVLSRIQVDTPLPPPAVDEFPTVEDDAGEHMYHHPERENEHHVSVGPYEHMGWTDMVGEEAKCFNTYHDDDNTNGDVFNEHGEGDDITGGDERAVDAEDLHFSLGFTEYHNSLPHQHQHQQQKLRGLGNYASCPPQFPAPRVRKNNGGSAAIRWDYDTPWSPTAFMRSASQWRQGTPEVTLPRPLYVRSGPPASADEPRRNMNFDWNMLSGKEGHLASWGDSSQCHQNNHTSRARGKKFTPVSQSTSQPPRNFLSNFQSTAAAQHDEEADEPVFNSHGEFMGYLSSSHSSRDPRVSEGRQVHQHPSTQQLSHPSMASSGDEVTFHPNLRAPSSSFLTPMSSFRHKEKQKSADCGYPSLNRSADYCGYSGTVNSSGDEVLSFPGMMRVPDSVGGYAHEYYIGSNDDDVDDALIDEFTSPSDDVARQMGADRIYSRSMGANYTHGTE